MNAQRVAALAALLVSTAFAQAVTFRPLPIPTTTAPYTSSEIVAQARRTQACDPTPVPGAITPVPTKAVSGRVARLFDEDQKVRMTDKIDWAAVMESDRVRRQEVILYVLAGQLVQPKDFVGAGFIFQHGPCPDSYLLAHQLSGRAVALYESSSNSNDRWTARWLYAATWDRYLMDSGKPQRFGTQYRQKPGKLCEFELYAVDPVTTDAERAQYNVPSFEAAKAKAKTFNCK